MYVNEPPTLILIPSGYHCEQGNQERGTAHQSTHHILRFVVKGNPCMRVIIHSFDRPWTMLLPQSVADGLRLDSTAYVDCSCCSIRVHISHVQGSLGS